MLSQYLPTAHRLGFAVGRDRIEVAAVEQFADQLSGRAVDRHRVRLRRCLQAHGQVVGVADDLGGTSSALGDFADDGHARRGTNPAAHWRVDNGFQRPDRRTQFKPRPDRPLGIVLVRCRIAEENQHRIAEIAGDEPVVASDRLCNAAPKCTDGLAPVLEVHAVGFASQLAGHRGYLAAFGVLMRRRRKLRCGRELGRRLHGACLPFGANRPDESVAATRQRLNPALAAGRRGEHPPQRCDLYREVALLDGHAGPRGLEQGVFGDRCAGLLEQLAQQCGCAPADRERFGAAKKDFL